MTTKFKLRPKAMRITRDTKGMHLILVGYDPTGKKYPVHEYTETTKSLNELVDYYVEAFPLVVRVTIDVAIVPREQRMHRVTPL